MKPLFRRIGAVAASAALTCCLFGCSNTESANQSSVEIADETLSIDELGDMVRENEMNIWQNYINKPITVTGTVQSVSSGDVSIQTQSDGILQTECEFGYVTIAGNDTDYIVEISEEQQSIAASLEKGTAVTASGIFSGFNEYGNTMNVYLLTHDNTGKNEATTTIDIIAS